MYIHVIYILFIFVKCLLFLIYQLNISLLLISSLDRFPIIATSDNSMVLTFPHNLLFMHPKNHE